MNNLKKTAVTLTLGLGGLVAAAGANAEQLLDFTSATLFPGAGNPVTLGTPLVIGNATVTSSSGVLKFYSPYEGPAGTGLAGDYDGVGITNDELVGDTDVLTVSFASARTVTQVQALDLFTTTQGTEKMEVKFFDSADLEVGSTTLVGTDSNPSDGGVDAGGYVIAALNVGNVSKVTFKMLDGAGLRDDGTADGAVAGLTTVPIPAAAWLFGSALVGMVGMGRRKLKKA